jgi:hypothetical protein
MARRGNPVRHVGILGIGQDEFLGSRISRDAGQLPI